MNYNGSNNFGDDSVADSWDIDCTWISSATPSSPRRSPRACQGSGGGGGGGAAGALLSSWSALASKAGATQDAGLPISLVF